MPSHIIHDNLKNIGLKGLNIAGQCMAQGNIVS